MKTIPVEEMTMIKVRELLQHYKSAGDVTVEFHLLGDSHSANAQAILEEVTALIAFGGRSAR
jgi:hypothetical protein